MSIQWAEYGCLPYGVVRVDCEGPSNDKSYVMYHGTTRANAQSILVFGFRQSEQGMLGQGVYLSRDLQKASVYPIGHPDHDKVVIKVLVKVGKVKAIDCQNHPLQKTWHDHGYDTAWVPPNCGMVSSGREENCVWDPKRITVLQIIKPNSVRDTGFGPRPIPLRTEVIQIVRWSAPVPNYIFYTGCSHGHGGAGRGHGGRGHQSFPWFM